MKNKHLTPAAKITFPKTRQITLINSDYQKPEAEEVVRDLIRSKIKFLKQKQFSILERFGVESGHLNQRAQELQEELDSLEDLLQSTVNPEQVLSLHCEINITFNP
ncbi:MULTISPECIES: hypothetical protein [Persicobacter]|uniref:Uncharacterized protein n=1 Tax=Persicobacter diffluens TaxID=981 RepID=A0AAN5AJ62_9BACT|nr:hypothetical protein [Persicobacter sp. CCB-QB2]GJM60567.1 hypothetical protein PEDI_11190 [Persicobacter diffluens]